MDIKEEALKKHYEWQGKIEVISRAPIKTREDLSLAYTPGVAQACLEIKDKPELSYELTRRKNLVAVITDGHGCSISTLSQSSIELSIVKSSRKKFS